jgi:hypothetical protein
VGDSQQRHGARDRGLDRVRGRLQRLQLAARSAVENFPSTRTQVLANGVGRLEVAVAPARGSLSQELLGFVPR